jgi:type I restriction enzyme S subunit
VITTELISQQEDKRKLPDGWRWIKLADVCDRITDGTHQPPPFTSSGVPFLFVRNIVTGRIDFNVNQFVSQETYEELTRRCRPMRGDLLFSAVGSFGVAVVIETDRPFTFQRHIALIKPKREQIYPYFLAHYLNSPNGRQQSEIAALGVAQRTVTLKSLSNFEIPLPPLDEQKRIAAILNEQMEAVERSRQATLAQLEAAKALPAAYLRAVFNSPEAQKWERKPLGVVGEIVSGITLGRNLNGIQTHRIPYLRVANVKDGYLDLSDVYEIEATDADIKKCRLKYGDILLTEGGDPDKLGRGTFWEEQIPECIHQNHIFRVRFDLNEFLPQFISAQIGSPYGKAYFLTHAKRTTGIATINRQVLAGFPLMVPSIDEQKRITITLTEQLAEVERLQQSLKFQLDAINKLPATLLRRAFNGDLS